MERCGATFDISVSRVRLNEDIYILLVALRKHKIWRNLTRRYAFLFSLLTHNFLLQK